MVTKLVPNIPRTDKKHEPQRSWVPALVFHLSEGSETFRVPSISLVPMPPCVDGSRLSGGNSSQGHLRFCLTLTFLSGSH